MRESGCEHVAVDNALMAMQATRVSELVTKVELSALTSCGPSVRLERCKRERKEKKGQKIGRGIAEGGIFR